MKKVCTYLQALLLVSKLLYRGADAAAVDENGQTVLHYATKREFVSVAERLLEFGASATQQDKMDRSPLSIALNNQHDKLTALFISHIDNSEYVCMMVELSFHASEWYFWGGWLCKVSNGITVVNLNPDKM